MALLATILTLAALAAGDTAANQTAGGTAAESETLPPLVPYAELLTAPDQYTRGDVRLHLQFHSLVFDWDPYITRFSPARFLGLSGWSDEQLTWEREQYEQPAVRLFIDRDDPQIGQFLRARRHARFELTCRVRSFLAGDVWIEVLDVQVAPRYLPEGSVLHAIRGQQFMQDANFALAVGEFERALAAPLPDRAQHALESFVLSCRYAIGEIEAGRGPGYRRPADSPILPLDAPTSSRDAPTLGRDTPTLGRATPTIPLDAPTVPPDAPTVPPDAPAVPLDAPAHGSDAPAKGSDAPAKGSEAPAKGSEAPAKGTEAPAKGTEAPAKGNDTPAKANDASAVPRNASSGN